ncbi:hypothetical protein AWB92_10835 [Mycobacterium sp. IEC1808]|uniref:DUF2784 domain-containing protein n=1 Tax=Mycobacterium sp. IEC1808 TaxID=1743230 RepID=UPI000A161A69|nr:DUF2784 domain-containing protein [Mycobacterium sp. IEC1808]ORW94261.1 hypothetical protein AWB92_10835 [Mycobacterium sp. IEC1808]
MTKAHFACFKYLVTLSVGAHFAYLCYVPCGGFLALRWPRTIWLHLASVCWGVAVVTLPVPCPLTSLENWARLRAGMTPLPSTGFVDRYVAGVIYPAGRTGTVQTIAFLAAVTSWIALAKRRRNSRSGRATARVGSFPARSTSR